MEMKDKIKTLREQQGLTLEEVGNIVGVGKSTVRKWETGAIANMRRDKITKIAEALHTTPAYLMGWEDAPVKPKTKGLGAGLGALLGDRMEPPISEAGKRIGRLYDKADERDKHVVETVLEAYDTAKAKDA